MPLIPIRPTTIVFPVSTKTIVCVHCKWCIMHHNDLFIYTHVHLGLISSIFSYLTRISFLSMPYFYTSGFSKKKQWLSRAAFSLSWGLEDAKDLWLNTFFGICQQHETPKFLALIQVPRGPRILAFCAGMTSLPIMKLNKVCYRRWSELLDRFFWREWVSFEIFKLQNISPT